MAILNNHNITIDTQNNQSTTVLTPPSSAVARRGKEDPAGSFVVVNLSNGEATLTYLQNTLLRNATFYIAFVEFFLINARFSGHFYVKML